MSRLIWVYTVCSLVFKFSIKESVDETFSEILQTKVLSSAFNRFQGKYQELMTFLSILRSPSSSGG